MAQQKPIPKSGNDDEEWLTTAEAALFLGLSCSTLSHYRSQGGGPIFYKIGWRISYAKSDLIAWRDGQRWSSTSNKLDD